MGSVQFLRENLRVHAKRKTPGLILQFGKDEADKAPARMSRFFGEYAGKTNFHKLCFCFESCVFVLSFMLRKNCQAPNLQIQRPRQAGEV